ncbi:uncharacterized protein V1513DRAFT_455056 [Lipomyces chichibuensis]|uniref:uncharacterized protein n=1 Tax=Lipomyces chichibuensis TaxID=1546026 RepID=UPI003343031F
MKFTAMVMVTRLVLGGNLCLASRSFASQHDRDRFALSGPVLLCVDYNINYPKDVVSTKRKQRQERKRRERTNEPKPQLRV